MQNTAITALTIVFVFAGLAVAESPVEPQDSLALFHVPDGISVDLVAAEPEVTDPVALCFDADHAMYVVEDRGYPVSTEKLGRVAILRDEDQDGYYEHRVTFADDFDFPNGVMVWRDGILLTCAPNVYYLRDTDGDDVADVREVVLSGFSEGGSTQLRVSHPTLGLDNWIHFTNGLSGGSVRIGEGDDNPILEMGAQDLRFDPFGLRLATEPGRAQFGLAFDDHGNKFVCSNRKHIEHAVMHAEDLARNASLGLTDTVADIPDHGGAAEVFSLNDARTTAYAHAGTFTAACGLVIYRGDAFPDAYRGNAFVCEPTGGLVHRDVLVPEGATFVAKRAREGVEFLASTDNWFRPVFLANAPDGALYLCDMYRETIEHPTYLPPEVAAVTNFESGNDRGRIYRVRGAEKVEPVRAVSTDTAALLARLASARSWDRETAHRLLLESRDVSLADPLRAIRNTSGDERARLHALSLLDGLGVLKAEDLDRAATDASPRLREQAVRLRRLHPDWTGALAGHWPALAADADARVRHQTALALGDIDTQERAVLLAAIARHDVNDPWTRAAVLSSVAGIEKVFGEAFVADLAADGAGTPEMMGHVARLLARAESVEAVASFVGGQLAASSDTDFAWRAAMAHGAASVVGLAALREHMPANAARLDALLEHAAHVAADEDVSVDERARAIALLGDAPYARTGDVLAGLLTPLTPGDLQVAAVRALDNMNDDAVATRLAAPAAWAAYTPPVKTAVMQALLKNATRLDALLTAMESGQIGAWSVDPVNRKRLEAHRDAAIAARARSLFVDIKRTDRATVFEEYKPVLELTPDSANGRAVFLDTCSRCHLFNGEGYEVGPDLSGIRSQPLESILLHILVPNSLMLEGYETYVVETDEFETFSGIITAENETSITLRQALGIEETIPRANIVKMEAMGLSMMPEELEKNMTRQQLRDLIGYLKGE